MLIPNKSIIQLKMTSRLFKTEMKLWENGMLKIVCVCMSTRNHFCISAVRNKGATKCFPTRELS